MHSSRKPTVLTVRRTIVGAMVVGIFGLSACSLSNLVDVQQPTDLITPDQIKTPAGAMGLYAGAMKALAQIYGGTYSGRFNDILASGMLTDELRSQNNATDARTPSSGMEGTNLYFGWQRLRMQATQAAWVMQRFHAQIPDAVVSRMYALVGYSELFLAERFCSGIPLSKVPMDGGSVQYSAGLTTSAVLDIAIAHFDTAIAMAGDSVRFKTLARVGKARALIALAKFDDAKAVLAGIPTEFVYNVEYSTSMVNTTIPQDPNSTGIFVTDSGEGGSGIDWLHGNDPRVPIVGPFNGTYRPAKYADSSTSIPLATGVEARLIEAEAAQRSGSASWLTILNDLRTDGTYTVHGTDTLWNPGSGGVAGLKPLNDPGAAKSTVDLLFRERAFWLYLTGHRHGDLRRLIRQYGRSANSVFPTGVYRLGPNAFFYGNEVVFMVPNSELDNPLYKGCIDGNA